MSELNKYLCDDVTGIVGDYLNGDSEYWKDEYNKTVNLMNKCENTRKINETDCALCTVILWLESHTNEDDWIPNVDMFKYIKLTMKNSGKTYNKCIFTGQHF